MKRNPLNSYFLQLKRYFYEFLSVATSVVHIKAEIETRILIKILLLSRISKSCILLATANSIFEQQTIFLDKSARGTSLKGFFL